MTSPATKIKSKSLLIGSRESGVTLLLSILVLASIMAISFSLATVLFVEVRSSGDLLRTEGALYAATGVGEQALFDLKRSACTSNNSSCYTSQFTNNVVLTNAPSVSFTANPIFTDKALTGSNLTNTSSKYDFCNVTSGTNGCNYGKVTVNYVITNNSTDQLSVYLCQWDPFGSYTTLPCSTPSTSTSTQAYWLASQNQAQTGDGSVTLNSGNNQSVTWLIDPTQQQELILTNPNGSNNIYFSVASYDVDTVTPKGLPYVGKTAIDVSALNGQVGRKIQVVVPDSGSNGASSTPTALFLINSGGSGITDSRGRVWTADSSCNYSGTSYSPFTVGNSISGAAPADQPVYQSSCYSNGSMTYTFPVPNGNHAVTLKFAEDYWTGPGQRLFNVSINGVSELTNFDIYAQAGGQYKALDETFIINATTGNIQIVLTRGPADNPTINGIEIDN